MTLNYKFLKLLKENAILFYYVSDHLTVGGPISAIRSETSVTPHPYLSIPLAPTYLTYLHDGKACSRGRHDVDTSLSD